MSRQNIALSLLLLIAWTARFVSASVYPSIQYPDEIYQVLEPAHRWVFGYGIESWEWQRGIRSPVPPALFVPVFELARWMGLDPGQYLALVRAIMAAVSLTVVWTAFRIGKTWQEGCVIAIPAALWCEMVLFSPHPLVDVMAASLLVPGLYLLQKDCGRARLVAGILLALVCLLRPALGPPVVLAAVMSLRGSWPAWRMLLLGAVIAALPYGAADLTLGRMPFSSTIGYVLFNISSDASAFGTSDWTRYVLMFVDRWGAALPFLLLLLALGARGQGVWLVTAVLIVLELSLVPHKEERFVFPAIACLMIPLGVGLSRVAGVIKLDEIPREALTRIAVLAFIFCSLIAAMLPTMEREWRRGAAGHEVFAELGRQKSLCAVGLHRGVPLTYMGGQAVLHRPVPIYDRLDDPAAHGRYFTDLLTPGPLRSLPADFQLVGCRRDLYFGMDDAPGAICHYRRPGTCAALGADGPPFVNGRPRRPMPELPASEP